MILNPPSKFAKNVVRDLFYGCWCKGKRIASAKFPPTTLLYIYTVLKENGHDVTLLDSQSNDKNLDEIKRMVSKEEPEVIVIPTSTMSFNEDIETLKELKNLVNTTTLAFGSHVTFLPKISLEKSVGGIDYIVMREPEYIIRDFVNTLQSNGNVKNILGIGYNSDGQIKINELYPFIENLDELPFPDREPIIKYEYFNPLVKKLPWTTAITSRGCPGKCNFCTAPPFYGLKIRMRSPENVVDEMQFLKELGFNEVFFRDETFTADRKRNEKICELIKERGLDISWICNARVGTVDKEIMIKMRKAGCHLIKFGVESGDQVILNNIRKGISVEMTRKTFNWANEIGMETHAHMMLGCVGETRGTIDETIEFVKEIKPTTVTFNAFTPYPGTYIFDVVKKEDPKIGDGSNCDLSKIHTIGFYNYVFCDLTDREIGIAIRMAYKKFYFRPFYILNRLRKINSLNEFRRIVSAGLNVLSFGMETGD